MIKAVLFDLDGTLVNSLEDLATSTNYALSLYGYPTHETEKYKYFVGDGMPKLIERTLPADKRSSSECERVLKSFLEYYSLHYVDKTVVYDGIKELISSLKAKGYKLAVISNKAHNMAVTVTQKLLPNSFDEVFGKMDGYPTKPDAALTLELMKRLKVNPQECVMVGDSGMDMAVAKNVGCKSIGVLWGFRQREELIKNGADYIAADSKELYSLINSI